MQVNVAQSSNDRSPARIGTFSQFSAGGSGQLQRSLYAQYGLYAMLKSTSQCSSSSTCASSYLPAPYVSRPDVASC